MIKTIILVLFAVRVLAAAPVAARDVDKEPSRYGQFTLRYQDDRCSVNFSRIGKEANLLFEGYCMPPCKFEAEESIGNIKLPYITENGQEYHIFSFPTHCPGNAASEDDYYVMVVNSDKIWAPHRELFSTSRSPTAEAVTKDGVNAIKIINPPTTTERGKSYLVSMGKMSTSNISKLPCRVVKTKTEEWNGLLSPACHATDDKPVIENSGKDHSIDYIGKCNIDNFINKIVVVKVKVQTWSDGRKEATCQSIKLLQYSEN